MLTEVGQESQIDIKILSEIPITIYHVLNRLNQTPLVLRQMLNHRQSSVKPRIPFCIS